ncbi:50S ribosomal protein L25 [Candidatus Kaiserbacteria bacterium CG10_big_fil_rev_8_21_14_0_10_49_17]|uniref:Large ribosomal subunit protein bL25 n=1 Tax=Candidatus Kaiserbacteria bacterium CG10_big_fil_rev_8_21_14_0_10_49_17 TaxID=1974609 RepID=A0A2M6WF46_9BACT|nr:MAG: 50S ribosomal protein L25 [Candidatus Kaiserbacteria bacterium CG10_big_fil_rev_8_21_14_0_10_49_17]
MVTLTVEKRDTKGKPSSLRKSGSVPAIFYGPKEEATAISLPAPEFLKVWREAGESTVVTLKGPDFEKEVLIQEVAVDPVTGAPIHADFYAIEKGKKVQVSIHIEFTGEAPAVKELGGSLVKVLHEIEIEAEPHELPHEVTVDVSSLKDFDSQLTAGDITLPAGVTLVTDPNETVALVSAAKEEVEEPQAEVDFSQIEVEERGKKDEGGDDSGSEE